MSTNQASMKFEKPEDFYQVYNKHRTYVLAKVQKKYIRNFDAQVWKPADMRLEHSVLEIGCGTGLFLAYLKAKGITKFVGIDQDHLVQEYMPESISDQVFITDVWEALKEPNTFQDFIISEFDGVFDRIVMLDFFEHFSCFEGQKLLTKLRRILDDDGKIILRIPNMASPFALQYQYGDLTHKTPYAPGSIGQVALASGYRVERFVPVWRGSRVKQFMERALLWIADRILTEPPPLWTANMIVVLAQDNS